MGPGDREKCGKCRKKVAYDETYAFTDGLPFCSLSCYMKHIKEVHPTRYAQLSVVLGEF